MKFLTLAALAGAASAADDSCFNVFTKVTQYKKDCSEAADGQTDDQV